MFTQEPILMSTGWLGRRWGHTEGSIVARHEVRGSINICDNMSDHVCHTVEGNVEAQRRARRLGRQAEGRTRRTSTAPR